MAAGLSELPYVCHTVPSWEYEVEQRKTAIRTSERLTNVFLSLLENITTSTLAGNRIFIDRTPEYNI
jgi:hypothetical protein